MPMRLFVGLVAAGMFAAALLLDTQAVLQLAWMAAVGRFGAWLCVLVLGAAVLVAVGARVLTSQRRRRPGGASRSPEVMARDTVSATKRAATAKARNVERKGGARTTAAKAAGKRAPPRPRKG